MATALRSSLQLLLDDGTTSTGAVKTSTQTYSSGIKPGAAGTQEGQNAWAAIALLASRCLTPELIDSRCTQVYSVSE